jgi:hypothetical protein
MRPVGACLRRNVGVFGHEERHSSRLNRRCKLFHRVNHSALRRKLDPHERRSDIGEGKKPGKLIG